MFKRVVALVAVSIGIGFSACDGLPASCENNAFAVATPYATPVVSCGNGATCQVTKPASGKYMIDCDPATVAGETCWIGGEYCFRENDLPTIDSFSWVRGKPVVTAGSKINSHYGVGCCVDVGFTFAK